MAVVVLAGLGLVLLAVTGWGLALSRLCRMAGGLWPRPAVVGLGVVLALGGVLNALHLAYPAALLVVVLAGLSAAGWFLRGTKLAVLWAEITSHAAAYGLAGLVLAVTVATQLPPDAYSYADDYGKYFFHPLAMLHSGSVFSGPANALGSETLGGKAFLDGFIVAAFPLRFLNATDAVFGLLLCLLLAARLTARPLTAAALVLAVAVIEPQYINISPLWLGAALMMGAAWLAAEDDKTAIAVGLIYAGLVSLKTTFALFVPVHLVLAAAGFLIAGRPFGAVARWAGVAAGLCALALAPWLLTHLPHYLAGLAAAPLPDAGMGPLDRLEFFSPKPLAFAASMLQYTLLVLIGVAAAALAVWSRGKAMAPAAAAAATLLACYAIMMIVYGPALAGYFNAVRYVTPFAIGLAPAVLGLAAATVDRRIGLAMVLAPALLFAPDAIIRLNRALDDGFILSFPAFAESRSYADFNARVWNGSLHQDVARWQALVPPGEPITAWINTPFYLDQSRNPVEVIDTAGLATRWARLPEHGYVIYEYGGFASAVIDSDASLAHVAGAHERQIAMQKRAAFQRLRRDLDRGTALYQDDRVAVFKLR
jgi:hypothetical protein